MVDVTQREKPSIVPVARVVLSVVEGPDQGASIAARGDEPTSVGSAPGNALCLHDPKVSRYHLELHREEGGLRVVDLGSLNGTWLGRVRCRDVVVHPPARLRVGDTTLEVSDGGLEAPPGAAEGAPIEGFVGASLRGQRIVEELRRLAPTQASVLLRGETGTGKEVAAQALHRLSHRRDRPFVVVDCGAMPATLIASELFGHERGAFTGADRRRVGAFERAEGGTVFLDEIGELPMAVQPSLLGVLERRRFRRVGGDDEVEVDVRVLSATHRDLRRSVNDGSFRADLYYRLAVAVLRLPPLRERSEDIPALVAHFTQEVTGSPDHALFHPAVIASLKGHRWSGNIRELRNVVESALAMGRVRLEPDEDEAGDDGSARPATTALDLAPYKEARAAALDAFEREYLAALTTLCGKNASEGSRRARMDRNYLVSLLKKHGFR